MKTFLKSIILLSILLTIVIVSCKKADTIAPAPTFVTSANEHYTSISDFFSRNQISSQTHNVDGTTGGTFTTAQGTVVTIPANGFLNTSGGLVSGAVTIEFKDLYKKSDMFFSSLSTSLTTGQPMKSGGEFFIKATAAGAHVSLATGSHITVKQPTSLTGGMDAGMLPFNGTAGPDGTLGWAAADTVTATVSASVSNYLYDLTVLTYSGNWCNSDNCSFFSAYPQTILTMHETENQHDYSTVVYLVFTSVNSCIHTYYDSLNNFPYNYAPVGLPCTIVALGIKDGKLYSSFTPVTITTGMIVDFSLTETTTDAFKAQFDALN